VATFVLVHGAFHGAWCWARLVPELEARGHRAVALDLPGLGEDRTPLGEVTLEGNVAAVAGVVGRQAEPVVLVGHSMGGVTIASVAEQMPERIALLVFLAAFMPRSGESVLSLSRSPGARRESGPPAFTRTPDGLGFMPVLERARAVFYARCSNKDVAYAIRRLRPQALAVQRAPVTLTEQRYGTVPRVFFECLEDNAVSLGLQRSMVQQSPCPVVSLPTDHSPFFSAPALLAEELAAAAAQVRPKR
jgi:pimeloyl-ACP methyl ester carboxylesterase